MQTKYHWSNYYKRAELLTLSAYIAIPPVISVVNLTSFKQHLFSLVFIGIVFYIEKMRGFTLNFFMKYLKTKMGGKLRSTQKYRKPV